jgi:hypothetical protein
MEIQETNDIKPTTTDNNNNNNNSNTRIDSAISTISAPQNTSNTIDPVIKTDNIRIGSFAIQNHDVSII